MKQLFLSSLNAPYSFLEQLFMGLPLALQVYRRDGVCVLVNPTFVQQFGLDPTGAYNVLESNVPQQRGMHNQILRAFAGEVQTLPTQWYTPLMEVQRPHFVHRRLAISLTLIPIKDEQGEVTHVLVLAEDKTAEQILIEREAELKKAREEAEATAQRERSLRQQWDAVIDSMVEAVVLVDREGEVVLVNPAAKRILGGIQNHLNTLVTALDAHYIKTGELMTAENSPALRGVRGEVVQPELIKITALDAPGVERILSVSAAPLRDGTGEIIGAVSVGLDVTESYQENRFRELFMGILGHDLRTPLSVISLAADNLDMALSTSRDKLTAQLIRRNAEQIRRLVNDLLDFTRVRLGDTLPFQRQRVDLYRLCEDTVNDLRLASPQRELRLELDGGIEAGGGFIGQWDPDRMSQVITNLITNALHHSAEGSPVEVRLENTSEQVVLSVHNEGPEIPASKLRRMFSPFCPNDPGEAGGELTRMGLGLGLFIVREIVKAHGGTVGIESGGGRVSVRTVWPKG